MRIIKPKKVWVHKDGKCQSVSILIVKDLIADGWKVGKLLDKAEFLDNLQQEKEEILKRKET